MKFKKLLAVALSVVILFGALPLSTLTVSATTYSGSCGENLNWSLNTNTGVLTITGEGDMYDYGYFTDVSTGTSYNYGDTPWYWYKYYIKTIILPNGLTYIGNDAFYNCYNLASVNLPNTIALICSGAFANTALTEIKIPEGVRYIGHAGALGSGRGVFQDCTNLKSVKLPESLFSIGMDSFSGCSSLVDISLPKSLNMICSSAFYDCYSLESVYYCGTEEEWNTISIDYGNEYLTNAQRYNHKFGAWITDANGRIYRTCSLCGDEEVSTEGTSHDFVSGVCSVCKVISAEMLTYTVSNNKATITACDTSVSGDVIIPSILGGYSVKTIDSDSFFGCSRITDITIPDSVTSISEKAFYYCSNLKNIIVDSNNANYCSVDGVLFDKNKTTILCCPGGKSGEYRIPDNVTSVGNYAFGECRKITKIYIPDTVSQIGTSAFKYCQSLTSINIPATVTSIGYGTFNECRSLPSIVIPDTVKSIGDYAFSYCRGFTSVTIPNSVTSIGNYAFSSCHYLVSAVIPNSVTKIGDGVFNYCDVFKNIYYCGTEEQWNKISIGYSNTKLTYATKYYHNFSDWVISTESTCSSSGNEYRTCSLCGEVETQTIPMKAHTYTSKTTDPTCTKDGYTTYTCQCGDSYVADEVAAIGHNFGDWIVITNATCEVDGQKYKICSVCGNNETQVIPATGHSHTAVHIEKNCTEYGYTVYTCENCGDTYIVIDSENGYAEHTYPDEWTIKAVATCIAGGENYKICAECGYTITQITEALGHDYSKEFTIDKIATDFEAGSKSRHCSRCDSVTEVTAIPKTSIADGVCGKNAVWAVREDGTLVIAGSGATQDFGSYGETPWFDFTDTITNVNIGENITYIGFYSFGEIMGLQSVKCDNPNIVFGKWYMFGVDEIVFYGKGGGSLEEYVNANNYTLIKPESPETPITPQLLAYNSTSVSLVPLSGYEYSIDGMNWQTLNMFENLQPFTQYSFYQRIADNVYKASQASEALSVLTAVLPEAPAIDTIVGNTVKLHSMQTYEYSIDGVTWEKTDTFKNFEYNRIYYIYSRYIPTEMMPNPTVSTPAKVIVLSAPEIQLVGETAFVVKPIEGCLYSINGKVWQSSNVFTKLIPGYSYTVWQKYAAESVYSVQSEGTVLIINGQDEVDVTPDSTNLASLGRALLDLSKDMSLDYNADGEINIKDLVRLKKFLAGEDVPLGNQSSEAQTVELLSETAYLDQKDKF